MNATRELRHDLPAGIVVFFVAVPLCLGIALASGAPLFAGLIAGIVGGIVVGSLSGSPLGVSGPAAGLAVIVLEAIESLGSFEAFLLAVVFAGFIQIALGAARAGVLAYFFPSSVIKGMLSGIGLLIILKQIPHALGWDSDPEGDFAFVQADGETTFSEILRAADNIDPSAVLVAGTALAILIVWERVVTPRGGIFQLIQGPLVAVAFGIAFQSMALQFAPGWALSADQLVTVPVPESFSQLPTLLTWPDWSQWQNPAIYATAFVLAAVASLETLLCVEATDKLDPQKRTTPANRELLAQGTGNVLSGLIGGLPVTQVIVRSSANIQSGGRTKASAIFHGFLLLVFAVGLPVLLVMIPLAVLASVLFVVGYKLAKPSLFAAMARQGPTQFVPFVVTIAGMLLTDLLTGIGLGMVVAILVILHTNYQNSHFLHLVQQDEPGGRHRVWMRLAENVTFLNRGAILRELSSIPEGSDVVIDLRQSVSIDHDIVELLDEFEESLPARDITLHRLERVGEPQPAGNPSDRFPDFPTPTGSFDPPMNGASNDAHPDS